MNLTGDFVHGGVLSWSLLSAARRFAIAAARASAIRREHDCRSIARAFAPRKIVMYNACHGIANAIANTAAMGAVLPVYSVVI
jgi:hypothetical protein